MRHRFPYRTDVTEHAPSVRPFWRRRAPGRCVRSAPALDCSSLSLGASSASRALRLYTSTTMPLLPPPRAPRAHLGLYLLALALLMGPTLGAEAGPQLVSPGEMSPGQMLAGGTQASQSGGAAGATAASGGGSGGSAKAKESKEAAPLSVWVSETLPHDGWLMMSFIVGWAAAPGVALLLWPFAFDAALSAAELVSPASRSAAAAA